MTMTEPTFTEIEVRVAAHLRLNPDHTFTKSDLGRIFADDATTRTVDRVLQRMVRLGVVAKTDEIRPALYRWETRQGAADVEHRLILAYNALVNRITTEQETTA